MSAVALALDNLDLNCIESSHWSNRIEECDLRDILRQFGELPGLVPEMPFTQLSVRLLDSEHFQYLVSQRKTQGNDSDWESRLQKRRANLETFIGQHLLCVFIRLPGVHYTIEVDPIRA